MNNETLRDMAYEIYEHNGDPRDALGLLIEATVIELRDGLVPKYRKPLKYLAVGPYDHFCSLRMQVDMRAEKAEPGTIQKTCHHNKTQTIDIQAQEPATHKPLQLALF